MSSPRHILTASQGPAGTTSLTSWRHSLSGSGGAGGGVGDGEGGVFNISYYSCYLSSLASPILPSLLAKQQGPFDAVTAGAGGFGSPPRLVETRPGQASRPVSPGQNLAFPQLIYEFDFDFDLPTVVRSE